MLYNIFMRETESVELGTGTGRTHSSLLNSFREVPYRNTDTYFTVYIPSSGSKNFVQSFGLFN